MMPILACLTSFLLACACCSSADFIVRESAARAPQRPSAALVARQQLKLAAPHPTPASYRARR